MQTDELRAELRELANEEDAFRGDLASVRRRVARRRAAEASIAIVVIAAVAVGAVALTRSNKKAVTVAHSVKNVELTALPRFDAVVVLPTGASPDDVDRVEAVLAASTGVEKYSALPTVVLVRALTNNTAAGAKAILARACKVPFPLPKTSSFAVELSRADPRAAASLASAIGSTADVQTVGIPNVDIEVFMQVHASRADSASVRAQIEQDPDVLKVTFMDHEAAFTEFRKLFADQPELIKNLDPADLPESFRLELRAGASMDNVADRYRNLPGVDQINTPSEQLDLDTRPDIPTGQVNLYMKPGATDAQIADVRSALEHDAIVSSYKWVDRGAPYEDLVQLFRGQRDGPEKTGYPSQDQVPAAFRITLRSQDDATTFVGHFQGTPGMASFDISRDATWQACTLTNVYSTPDSGNGGTTSPATTAP